MSTIPTFLTWIMSMITIIMVLGVARELRTMRYYAYAHSNSFLNQGHTARPAIRRPRYHRTTSYSEKYPGQLRVTAARSAQLRYGLRAQLWRSIKLCVVGITERIDDARMHIAAKRLAKKQAHKAGRMATFFARMWLLGVSFILSTWVQWHQRQQSQGCAQIQASDIISGQFIIGAKLPIIGMVAYRIEIGMQA
jgi:hypothetical protein